MPIFNNIRQKLSETKHQYPRKRKMMNYNKNNNNENKTRKTIKRLNKP